MREIKFRAFFKGFKGDPDFDEEEYNNSVKMVYDIQNVYDNCPNDIFPFFECFGEALKDEDCVIMQYTGLKDKNGKEIYEGDIIHLKHETGYNEWDESKEVVVFEMGSFSCGIYADPSNQCDCEVIGNIYETPELL